MTPQGPLAQQLQRGANRSESFLSQIGTKKRSVGTHTDIAGWFAVLFARTRERRCSDGQREPTRSGRSARGFQTGRDGEAQPSRETQSASGEGTGRKAKEGRHGRGNNKGGRQFY